MNKKGMEFGFAWLFAIIVGGVILFLAIFGVSKLIDTSQEEINTKVAVEFANVLDPLQTVVSESSGNHIDLPVEARIFSSCDLEGDFGNSLVSFSEKIGFGDKWSKLGGEARTKNTYLFSENEMQGKRINFLIFPFLMPYKVGDILIAYNENYCFVDTPILIENELRDLLGDDNTNIVFADSLNSCPDVKKVCFQGNCDIKVRCDDSSCTKGFVDKEGKRVYFTNKLIYGAIFSSQENYECNINRLMKRLSIISEIYSKKTQFVSSRDCVNIILRPDLLSLNASSANYRTLNDLPEIERISKVIDNKNEELECQLY